MTIYVKSTLLVKRPVLRAGLQHWAQLSALCGQALCHVMPRCRPAKRRRPARPLDAGLRPERHALVSRHNASQGSGARPLPLPRPPENKGRVGQSRVPGPDTPRPAGPRTHGRSHLLGCALRFRNFYVAKVTDTACVTHCLDLIHGSMYFLVTVIATDE